MGAHVDYPLVTPVSVTAGTALGKSNYQGLKHNKTLFVSGTFSATLQPQVALGTTWHNAGPAITAAGAHDFSFAGEDIRINTTVFTSGVPVVSLGGEVK